ncbi:MAG: 50S ribosomal protein L9 [Clostridiales bacterium]|jgi:large subunit ribosomal protein L9|nr:50S ribosomal protein L9 [Clostridiales bacterium]
MKVILLQDVKSLGKKDSIVEVSDGYGRNYLIPRKIAIEANPGNLNEVKSRKDSEEAKRQRELGAAKAVALQIDGKDITIEAKAGESGKLFGAISNADIADSIKKTFGIEIDKKKIMLADPIKAIGTFSAEVKLHQGVSAKVTVIVRSGE